MSLMKSTLFLGLILISLEAVSQQKTVHEFTLQQCVEYAMKNNAQVKNALLDIAIQEQDNKATTAGALPSLNGTGNYTDYLKIQTQLLPGEFFGQPAGSYVPVQFGTKYNASGSLALKQALFDGQVFVGLKARQTSIDFRTKTAAVTQDLIKLNVYKIYYQLLVSKTQIQQLDANIDRSQNLLHVNTEMNKNGFTEKLEVDKTTVQLANNQTEKEKALNQINNGYYGLKFLMGMPQKDSLVLTDSITDDSLKQGLLNEGVYDYNNRNDFLAIQATNKLNEYNVKRYKASYYPTLSLDGNYTRSGQGNQFNVFSNGQWFTSAYVGLNLSVPIFNGFQKNANLQKARLQLEQSQNTLQNFKDSVDETTAKAINDYHTAINTLDYQKKNVSLAEQVYYQSQKKYESGLGSTLDITNAEADLHVAQSNYVSAMYDAVIAKVDYLYATGQLK